MLMKLQIMTLVKNIISKSVVDILHKKLGPGDVKVSNDDQSCSLIRHREDHVWIWNAKGIKKTLSVRHVNSCFPTRPELRLKQNCLRSQIIAFSMRSNVRFVMPSLFSRSQLS